MWHIYEYLWLISAQHIPFVLNWFSVKATWPLSEVGEVENLHFCSYDWKIFANTMCIENKNKNKNKNKTKQNKKHHHQQQQQRKNK